MYYSCLKKPTLGLVLGLIVINRIMRISSHRYLLRIVNNSVVLSIKMCILYLQVTWAPLSLVPLEGYSLRYKHEHGEWSPQTRISPHNNFYLIAGLREFQVQKNEIAQ